MANDHEQQANPESTKVSTNLSLTRDGRKMIDLACVEIDTNRSEFMEEASVERAREVLKLKRSSDSGS